MSLQRSVRDEIHALLSLPKHPKPSRITELLGFLDTLVACFTPGLFGSDELLFLLVVGKLPKGVWQECRLTPGRKSRTLTHEDSSALLLELSLKRESDHHLDMYRPRPQAEKRPHLGLQPNLGTNPN